MLKIGITGSLYSGHEEVAEHFYNLGVPLFDADLVIKFILNYRQDYIDLIRKKIGDHIFYHSYLEPSKISYSDFSSILDLIKSEVFVSYEKWRLRYKHNYYTLFLCSVLYEKKWDEHMNYTINTYKPESMRFEDSKKQNTHIDHAIFRTEISELDKNLKSNWVVHNYLNNHSSLSIQIKKINNNIIAKLDNNIITNFLN